MMDKNKTTIRKDKRKRYMINEIIISLVITIILIILFTVFLKDFNFQ